MCSKWVVESQELADEHSKAVDSCVNLVQHALDLQDVFEDVKTGYPS